MKIKSINIKNIGCVFQKSKKEKYWKQKEKR